MPVTANATHLIFNDNTTQSVAPVDPLANVESVNGLTGDVSVSGTSFTNLEVKAASGTNIDFTTIGFNFKKIVLVFDRVSTSSTGLIKIRLGPLDGIPETTGYEYSAIRVAAGSTAGGKYTDGFTINTNSASSVISGTVTLYGGASFNPGQFYAISQLADTLSGSAMVYTGAGFKQIVDIISIIRVTCTAGSFDGGQIMIYQEA